MKKKLFTVMFALVATLSLTACGKKGTCEMCQTENVSLKKFTFQGESAWLCKDCYKLMDSLSKLSF